ncbi:MAG: methyltransferase domain-containing protein [Chloroflexota bacterium]|nr:methyltransferase domain-containing protein [Chloroflexota bacterium]
MNHPAFDALAPTYDADFTHTSTAQHLRARVHADLLRHIHPGNRALELGCGTGEDARMLGERGIAVTATDASPAMLAITQTKCAHLSHVMVAPLDLNALHDDSIETPPGGFALAFANFGVINCVHDLSALAEWLAGRVRVGGMVCFAVMSPLCLWEIVWQGAHGDLHSALRRLRGNTAFQPTPDSAPIGLTYPSVGALTRAFAVHFERVSVAPLGLVLPPSDLYAALDRRPRVCAALTRLDDLTAGMSALALYADHYWITFRRVGM